MSALYYRDREDVNLKDVVFEASVSEQIDQFLKEHKFSEILHEYELPVANKMLLFGKTGCGKTMTAKAIAKELDKRIFIVNLATVVSSKLGETAKISTVFLRKPIMKTRFCSLTNLILWDKSGITTIKTAVK